MLKLSSNIPRFGPGGAQPAQVGEGVKCFGFGQCGALSNLDLEFGVSVLLLWAVALHIFPSFIVRFCPMEYVTTGVMLSQFFALTK